MTHVDSQTNWDWVGIFRCEWRNLGEYTAYMWAQSESTDCTAPGRRAVVFPVSVHRVWGVLETYTTFYLLIYSVHWTS